MKRRDCIVPGLLLITAIVILAACVATTVTQGVDAAPETLSTRFPVGRIQIKLPGNEPRTQPAVPFAHRYHDKMLCSYCHHAFYAAQVVRVDASGNLIETSHMMGGMGMGVSQGKSIALVEPGKGNYSCSRNGCHTDRKSRQGWQSYWGAFHTLEGGSCMNCHVEERKYGKNPDVPVECDECHIAPTRSKSQ